MPPPIRMPTNTIGLAMSSPSFSSPVVSMYELNRLTAAMTAEAMAMLW